MAYFFKGSEHFPWKSYPLALSIEPVQATIGMEVVARSPATCQRSPVLWVGLRSGVPVPGLEAATHLHCHADDTTLPAASAPFPGRSTGCPGSASSTGPLHVEGRCQVLHTVSPASLGPVPVRLQACMHYAGDTGWNSSSGRLWHELHESHHSRRGKNVKSRLPLKYF